MRCAFCHARNAERRPITWLCNSCHVKRLQDDLVRTKRAIEKGHPARIVKYTPEVEDE